MIAALVVKENISGDSLVSEGISFVLEHLKGDDSMETMMLFVVWLEEQKKVEAPTSTAVDTPAWVAAAALHAEADLPDDDAAVGRVGSSSPHPVLPAPPKSRASSPHPVPGGTGWVLDGYWMGTGWVLDGYWMGTG